MELTPYEIALISAGFGIAGTLLGVLFTYRLALRLAKKQFENSIKLSYITEHKKSANDLRSAFAPVLATVRRDQTRSAVDIQRILEPDLDMLSIEMEKFRFYIAPKDTPSYDEACKEYQSIAGIRAMNYKFLGGKHPYKVFENRIQGILKFTKL